MRRVVTEGELLPRGYGAAWHDPTSRRVVCYPIPLHWIAGVARRIYWNLRAPPRGPVCEELREQIAGLHRQIEFLENARRCDAETTEIVARSVAEVLRDER